ncbi:hypothetical protein ACFX5L_10145 [Bacteroides sp. KG123]|uniref:hypothetical protein n=1 Tax=unclassified Bacteroides TaxID=2646097 RepID=UPI003D7FD48D
MAKGTAYPGLGLNQTDSEGLLKEAENEKTLLSFIREIALIFYQGGMIWHYRYFRESFNPDKNMKAGCFS